MEEAKTLVVRHGGREYPTSEEMAHIFRRQADRVIGAGQPDLVVLRHLAGVDLLLITGRDCYTIYRSRTEVHTDRPVLARG